MSDTVLIDEPMPGVARLTLNRPDKLNAWTGPMATALFDGMKAFEADPVSNLALCFCFQAPKILQTIHRTSVSSL